MSKRLLIIAMLCVSVISFSQEDKENVKNAATELQKNAAQTMLTNKDEKK